MARRATHAQPRERSIVRQAECVYNTGTQKRKAALVLHTAAASKPTRQQGGQLSLYSK